MSDVFNIDAATNTIKVELQTNYLNKDNHDHDKDFIARILDEKTMDVKDICSSILVRSGFNGDLGQMTSIINHYFREVIYRLCNGYPVTNEFFTMHPHLSGTFRDEHAQLNPEKNRFTIRVRLKKKFNDILKKIAVQIVGYSNADFCIDLFYDTREKQEWMFSPGNIFDIRGHNIRIEGTDAYNGLYLIPANVNGTTPVPQTIKVNDIHINEPTRIVGTMPAEAEDWTFYNLEIRTQYTKGAILKVPRTTVSRSIIEHV